MHIPKLLAIISVAALGTGSLPVHAQRADTDMQAAAREQMRQALEKLDAQNPAAATNMPPAPVKPKPVKKVAAPPPAPPTMVIAPATPQPVPPPPAAQAPTTPPPVMAIPEQPKPVAAVKQKPAPAKATGFSPYSPIAEPANTANPPVTLVIPGESPVVAPGNSLKHADERKAREEERKAMGETAPASKTELKFPAEAKMGTDTGAVTHSTPAPGSKEERLADLLDQYRADRISPADYQAQRAKILAEP